MWKRVLIGLLVLNVLGFTVYAFLRSNIDAQKTKKDLELRATAAKMEQSKIMPAEEYSKLVSIGDRANSSGEISEDDLNYLVQSLEETRSEVGKPAYVHLHVLADMACVKKFKPGQQDRILKASMPFLSSKDPMDQRGAIEVLKSQRYPGAVAEVLPLLNSPKENIRKTARDYLALVGYKASS